MDRQTTPQLLWFEGRVTVDVADGRLSIRNAPGGMNNRICFAEITVQ